MANYGIPIAGSKKYFPPANRCIYCDRRGVSLHEEHIIPFGLGGNWVLPKASCKKCEKVTNSFESPLLRGYLYPARVHMGFPSRHNDPRPDSFRMKFNDGSIASVPIADHPCVIGLPIFEEEPKLLSNLPPRGKINRGTWMYSFQPDLHRRVKNFTGRTGESAIPMRVNDFIRLLAKIGHAFASAELGDGKFKPLALEMIHGHVTNFDFLVGGLRDILQPKVDFHDVWLASYQTLHGTFLIANVQIFASLQGPIYRVVVGQFPKGSQGLARYYQAEKK